MTFVFYDGGDEHEPEPGQGAPHMAAVLDSADAPDAPSPWLWLGGHPPDGGLSLPEPDPATGSRVETHRPSGPTRPSAAAVLRIVDGPAAGESFGLPAGRTAVGRGSRADVRIDSPDVSREHCLLEVTATGEVRLTDLGSRNGTEVSGFRVTGPVPVGQSDIIALGGTVLVQVLPAIALPPPARADSVPEGRPGHAPPPSRAPSTRPAIQEPPEFAPGAPPRAGKPIFSIPAIFSPPTMAAVTVVITHQVGYAAIALVSALMVLVNFAGERSRSRRSARRDELGQMPAAVGHPGIEFAPEAEREITKQARVPRTVATSEAAPRASGAPDRLPDNLPLAALAGRKGRGFQTQTTGLPALAVGGTPDRQERDLVGWDPAAGNLLLYGMSGYGTTSALATLAIAVARARPPDAVHQYVMDLGAGKLAPLIGLPHVGAHIGPAEPERRAELIRLLRRELEARTASGGASGPAEVLVLIDNLASLLAGFGKDAEDRRVFEDLERVYAEGPTVGIRFAVTADRGDAVPSLWAALTEQKLLFRLARPGDHASFDMPHSAIPDLVPGRAVVAATGQLIQFAWPGADLAEQVARAGGCWAGASRVRRWDGNEGLRPV